MNASFAKESENTLRDPAIVMAPTRLGAMHQTRISFVRSLIRKMASENWKVSQALWKMSDKGFGTAVYELEASYDTYQLVVFSDAIADEDRNDRVIAEKWDVTFALIRGRVDMSTIEQLRQNVPLQEAGRNSSRVLVLARANKSVRVFEHLVSSLAQGEQPNTAEIARVGYILRTTAVYGNGKFGIADFETLQSNEDFNLTFSAQMCAVYILRQFSLDWVEYIAKQRGGEKASTICPELKRYLGIGNATGLGMAPYLIRHPRVVDRWLSQREMALASACSQSVNEESTNRVCGLLKKAQTHFEQIITINEQQQALNVECIAQIPALMTRIRHQFSPFNTWGDVLDSASDLSLETQEVLATCIMEIFPECVDRFIDKLNTDESLSLDPGISVKDMLEVMETRYRWAIDIDFTEPENKYWFWYRSQDKEEPRMGVRGQEPGEERELPLDVGRQVSRLYAALQQADPSLSLAHFLLSNPSHRVISRRVWTMAQQPMGDIQMNVLSERALPMHLLRCKLSMFGATKFDPRSDRWVRVTLFQGAPLVSDLAAKRFEESWLFPLMPCTECEVTALATCKRGVLA
ncbi:hypothetical protein [Enterovibrio norvegicus]|uniref:hypothetical protein n=1 Tax=Enterovibrio norvegicus TaxID=188144 RepID=UPI00354BFED8